MIAMSSYPMYPWLQLKIMNVSHQLKWLPHLLLEDPHPSPADLPITILITIFGSLRRLMIVRQHLLNNYSLISHDVQEIQRNKQSLRCVTSWILLHVLHRVTQGDNHFIGHSSLMEWWFPEGKEERASSTPLVLLLSAWVSVHIRQKLF